MNKSIADNKNRAMSIAAGWGAVDLRHLSAETFASIGMPGVVYIRPVRAGELADELGAQFTAEIDVPADAILYAVHAANGERMAVLDDRDAAFAGARQYELEPLSVH
ncbi:MAG: DUF1150 domain-containing protein [Parvibaculum sp.]|nr:DUF1150 domain-containing protein [Parvibaculum sp.]